MLQFSTRARERPLPVTTARTLLNLLKRGFGHALFKNLAGLTLLTVMVQAITSFTMLFIAHGLPKPVFGSLAFALAIQNYLSLFGGFGAKYIAVREAVQRPRELDTIVTSHLVITLCASLVTGLGVTVACTLTPVDREEWLLIVLFSLGNVALCINFRPFFDAVNRQRLCTGIQLLTELALLGVIVAMYRSGHFNLLSVGLVFVLRWTLATVAQYSVWHWWIRPLSVQLSWTDVRSMAISSLPLIFSSFLSRAPYSLSILFVKGFRDNSEIAALGLALQITSAFLLLAGVSGRVLAPHILGPRGMQENFLRKLIVFMSVYLAGLSTVFILATLTLSFVLINYADAVPLACLLILAGVGSTATASAYACLYALHQERRVFLLNVLCVIVYVALAMLLVPRYGALGASGSAVAASFTTTIIAAFQVHRCRSRALLKPVTASI